MAVFLSAAIYFPAKPSVPPSESAAIKRHGDAGGYERLLPMRSAQVHGANGAVDDLAEDCGFSMVFHGYVENIGKLPEGVVNVNQPLCQRTLLLP